MMFLRGVVAAAGVVIVAPNYAPRSTHARPVYVYMVPLMRLCFARLCCGGVRYGEDWRELEKEWLQSGQWAGAGGSYKAAQARACRCLLIGCALLGQAAC